MQFFIQIAYADSKKCFLSNFTILLIFLFVIGEFFLQLKEELTARQEAESKLNIKNNELTEIKKKLKEKEAKIAELEAKVRIVIF